jgi:ureidoglycolate hydrolase
MDNGTTVKVVPVTAEAFARYGRIVPLVPRQKPLDDNDSLTAWANVMQFEPGQGREVLLLRLKHRPMVLTQMERHVQTFEWWVNVEGECVAAFAEGADLNAPDELPDVDKIVVFNMSGVAGYVVNAGTWHWPAFPLGETATQFVDVRSGTVPDDVDIKNLPQPVTIIL